MHAKLSSRRLQGGGWGRSKTVLQVQARSPGPGRKSWRTPPGKPRFEIPPIPVASPDTRPISQPSVQFRQVSNNWGCIFRDTQLLPEMGPLPHFLPQPPGPSTAFRCSCRQKTNCRPPPASCSLGPSHTPRRSPTRSCSSPLSTRLTSPPTAAQSTRDNHVHPQYILIAPLSYPAARPRPIL